MSEVSLHRGLERLLCEVRKLESPWRLKNVGDDKAMGYLLRKAGDGWKQPKRKQCIIVSKGERSWRFKECLDISIEMQTLEFAQPASFSFAVVPHFLTVLHFLHLEMVMYTLCYNMLDICDLLFYFNRRL